MTSFITSTMRMMQANSPVLGSRSNRIDILAHWAVTGLATHPATHIRPSLSLTSSLLHPSDLSGWLKYTLQVWTFRVTPFLVDFTLLVTKIRQWSTRNQGFEELLQKQLTGMASDELVVEFDQDAFSR